MHVDDVNQWRRDNVPVFNQNGMKLGTFGQNCSNGCTMTHAPTTFEPTYEHNVKISQLADELGFEMLVPVGRWKHFGGSTKFNQENLEVYTWATAMAWACPMVARGRPVTGWINRVLPCWTMR